MSIIPDMPADQKFALQFVSVIAEDKPNKAVADRCRELAAKKDWNGLVSFLSQSPFKDVKASALEAVFAMSDGVRQVWRFLIFLKENPKCPAELKTNMEKMMSQAQWDDIARLLKENNAPFQFSGAELRSVVDPEGKIKPPAQPTPPAWTAPITWSIGAGNDVAGWTTGAANDVGNWTTGAAGDVGDWTSGAANDVGDWAGGAAGDVADGAKKAADKVADTFNPSKW